VLRSLQLPFSNRMPCMGVVHAWPLHSSPGALHFIEIRQRASLATTTSELATRETSAAKSMHSARRVLRVRTQTGVRRRKHKLGQTKSENCFD